MEAALEEAPLLTNVSVAATVYCAAHLVALLEEQTGHPDGGAGVIQEEQIGPRRVVYMELAETEREIFFASTTYGRRMMALESRTPRSVMPFVAV